MQQNTEFRAIGELSDRVRLHFLASLVIDWLRGSVVLDLRSHDMEPGASKTPPGPAGLCGAERVSGSFGRLGPSPLHLQARASSIRHGFLPSALVAIKGPSPEWMRYHLQAFISHDAKDLAMSLPRRLMAIPGKRSVLSKCLGLFPW